MASRQRNVRPRKQLLPYLSTQTRNPTRKTRHKKAYRVSQCPSKEKRRAPIIPASNHRFDRNKKRQEEDDIFEYLAGLNLSYEVVRAQIMNTIPLQSYSQIKNMIQQEESRREAMGGPQVKTDEGHETHTFAMAKRPIFQNLGQHSSSEKCEHCKKRAMIRVSVGFSIHN